MGTRSKPAVMGHSAHARIALVLCLVAFSCAVLGHKLQAAPAHLVEDGAAIRTELVEAGRTEGFLSKLFGTDCYSSAVRRLDADCRRLSEDQRQRLAYDLARCFLSRSGVQPLPQACPKSTPASQCTSALDDKGFAAYTQFFTNIHSVCLFISNQDFLQQAEQLTLSLHTASAAALESLTHIGNNITEQKQVLSSLSTGLGALHTSQQRLSTDVQEGLNRLQRLGERAVAVEGALKASVELQSVLSDHQQRTLGLLSHLSQEEEQRAQLAQQRWRAAEEVAAALEARQARYEALQSSLVSTSETLQGSLDSLSRAQQQSEIILGYLKGSSHTSSDLLTYATVAAVGWLLVSLLPPHQHAAGRALLGLAVGGCFCTERWLLTSLPAWGISLTPYGQVPLAPLLPSWLAPLLSWLPYKVPPLVLISVRSTVRGVWAAAAITLLAGRHHRGARRRRREALEMKTWMESLDKQIQAVAAQQQDILFLLASRPMHPDTHLALPAPHTTHSHPLALRGPGPTDKVSEPGTRTTRGAQPAGRQRGARAAQHSPPREPRTREELGPDQVATPSLYLPTPSPTPGALLHRSAAPQQDVYSTGTDWAVVAGTHPAAPTPHVPQVQGHVNAIANPTTAVPAQGPGIAGAGTGAGVGTGLATNVVAESVGVSGLCEGESDSTGGAPSGMRRRGRKRGAVDAVGAEGGGDVCEAQEGVSAKRGKARRK